MPPPPLNLLTYEEAAGITPPPQPDYHFDGPAQVERSYQLAAGKMALHRRHRKIKDILGEELGKINPERTVTAPAGQGDPYSY